MSKIVFLLLFAVAFSGCTDQKKSVIADFELDGIWYTINSAGIGYEVIGNNELDSSKGLNYMIELTIVNKNAASVAFNKSNYRLFDEDGLEMLFSGKSDNPLASISEELFKLTLQPKQKQEISFIYPASKHGVYRLLITSPMTSNQKEVRLPAS